MNWDREIQKDVVFKWFAFLISPFLGLLSSIKHINTKSSFVIFFLFSVLFGLNFTTSIGRDEIHRGDAAQYRMKFEQNLYMSGGDLKDAINEFRTFQNEEERDVYVKVMAYITSRFTYNYHVFFALLAVVFAYFMLKTLRFFTDDISTRMGFPLLILLYIFTYNSIFNINGCRFWTAAWVAVYSLFQIFRNGNKRYILLTLVTPAIHQSYWFFIGILVLILLFGKRTRLWKIAFFLSFILSAFSETIIVDLSDYLPPALQFLVDRYTEGENVLASNLYQVIRRVFVFASRVLYAVMVYFLMKNENEIKNNEKTKRLYPVLLIIMTISNFCMPIPSLGNRFIVLSYPFLAYLWYHSYESKGMYRNVLLLFPICNLMMLYEVGVAYCSFSVPLSFYYTSPLYQLYKYLIIGVIWKL